MMSTQPHPEDPVIARAVLLRERLLAGAGRLEELADRLLAEAGVLKEEAAAQQRREGDDGPGR